jgi:predicted TPR repeat methyltransferase
MEKKTYLGSTYGLKTPEDLRKHYDAWSGTYDEEINANGYATPDRIAKALGTYLRDRSCPILDFGCGTGLAGAALQRAGFNVIDGADPAPNMLAKAKAKNIYRKLVQLELGQPQPFAKGNYAAIVACGVIGHGAAPVSVLDDLIALLPQGGFLAFSFNDSTLKDRSFEGHLNDHLDGGTVRLLLREYGKHLPQIDMKSMVYVVEKT